MSKEILLIKERFMKIINYVFLFFVLTVSCQSPEEKAKKQEKFEWNAGVSAPKYYPSIPFVEYLYHGMSVSAASTGAGNGWGITSGGFTTGNKFKPVPDSVFVHWECDVDHLQYEAGFKLPRKKMLDFFNKGVINPFNSKIDDYTVLVAGTAPGGNVTIWMQAGSTITEIAKFKAIKKGIPNEGEPEHQKKINEIYNSKEYINSETNIYHYLHGVPYSVWEKGEKEYDYDIAFSSKDTTNYGYNLHFYAKDGSWFLLDKFNSFVPWGKTKIKTNQIIQTKYKVPVQLDFQWYTNEDNYKNRQWYSGKIILPQNLEDLMKMGLYKRFLVSIEKDNHTDCVEGTITLIGKNENKKIMNFKLGRYDYKLEKQLSPEYILPKDFVFPKWEGREPLIIPEIEYWQER